MLRTRAAICSTAYMKARPFSAAERDALPLLARGAALRFLLTRLVDWLDVPAGALVGRRTRWNIFASSASIRSQEPTDYGLPAEGSSA